MFVALPCQCIMCSLGSLPMRKSSSKTDCKAYASTMHSQAAVLQIFVLTSATALQAMELALREENNVLKERIRSFSVTTPVKSASASTSAAFS